MKAGLEGNFWGRKAVEPTPQKESSFVTKETYLKCINSSKKMKKCQTKNSPGLFGKIQFKKNKIFGGGEVAGNRGVGGNSRNMMGSW